MKLPIKVHLMNFVWLVFVIIAAFGFMYLISQSRGGGSGGDCPPGEHETSRYGIGVVEFGCAMD
jgi:hypothetical protein